MKSCCVIGLGYIGLPTAALLSQNLYKVIGVDINLQIVKKINSGRAHLFEPDLDEILYESIKKGNIIASEIPRKADVFIITVPTPFKDEHKKIPVPNIDYVLAATESICPYLQKGNLIILESTSPVGTTKKVADLIFEKTSLDIDQVNIAYCPERVMPGSILKELVSNDRVIGGLTKKANIAAKLFYKSFCKGEIYTTNSSTAELVKLSENAFRDVNIAFANELSMICHKLDIDSNELISLANNHPRVNIMNPGCGVGGHCIAVDPWFIASQNPEITKIIQVAREVNLNKIQWVLDQVLNIIDRIEKELGRKIIIGIMGLTYKPDVDDLRESPALKITNELIKKKFNILVCEPNIKKHNEIVLSSLEHVVKNADHLFFLVAHSEFKEIDLSKYNFNEYCGILNSHEDSN